MRAPSVEDRGLLGRVGDLALYTAARSVTRVVRAVPTRWVHNAADVLGTLWGTFDGRGRQTGRQNLDVAFRDGRSDAEKEAILTASYRSMARSMLMLLHASPMTARRTARWVDVPSDVPELIRRSTASGRGGVLVSGHVGNWELLLGLKNAIPELPELMFLAEELRIPAIDRILAELRGSGGGQTAMRRGGARALHRHVERGGAGALLADRNARSIQGGIWAPFFGLRARSTPLPGWIAHRHRVPVHPVFCLPIEGGRYRLWVGPNLAEGVEAEDEEAYVREITRRVNEVLERVIRARPELWNWTLKRFKSRPDRELGPYPAYSMWDPDDWFERWRLSGRP